MATLKKANFFFQDQLSLNAGQKYCRMLQREHSAILSAIVKLPFVIETYVLSIFEWQFYTGFTVVSEILAIFPANFASVNLWENTASRNIHCSPFIIHQMHVLVNDFFLSIHVKYFSNSDIVGNLHIEGNLNQF